MGRDYGTGVQFGRNGLARLALDPTLDPQRANRCSRFAFKGIREIDDSVAEIASDFPVALRGALIGGEESKCHALELLGADALDEIHFVAHRFEAAERFVVIE